MIVTPGRSAAAVRWVLEHQPGRRRAEFDALVGGMSLGGFAVEVDREGSIVHWSDGAELVYGWSRHEALG